MEKNYPNVKDNIDFENKSLRKEEERRRQEEESIRRDREIQEWKENLEKKKTTMKL